MISRFANWWASFITRFAVPVLLVAFLMTGIAFKTATSIAISTNLEALMPEGANSVQTLNRALKKTGSFASIQIVVQSDGPEDSLKFVKALQREIDVLDWVQSSQYDEDIDVLEQHKLLLLEQDDLLQLENDIKTAYPIIVAQQLADLFGTEVTFTLRGEKLTGNSNSDLEKERIEDFQTAVVSPPQTKRQFISDDGRTALLIVWPKPGLGSVTNSKRIVDETKFVLAEMQAAGLYHGLQADVVGRIASTVAQFDAILKDLKTGLLTAIFLITVLIIWSYRSVLAVPIIFIPLAAGIIWTIALTAITIGNLNLITVFLTLILFGLGIDFGIHNLSRYREEIGKGQNFENAIETVVRETGGASLIAALTTATSFFALTLTEFRAFTEFGFIAGSGILLAFVAMYTVMPALIVVFTKMGWHANTKQNSGGLGTDRNWAISPDKHQRSIFIATGLFVLFAIFFAPQMAFEKNAKNLEAKLAPEFLAAKKASKEVLKGSNSHAIIVVETQPELVAIDKYFKTKIAEDIETPTIKKVSSLLNFVPDQTDQEKRLDVIRRLEKRADELQEFDPEKYLSSKRYLSIDDLNVSDLPIALRRTYLGTESEPGYLMYVDNAVNMDDSLLAEQFYDDVAAFEVEGRRYFSASEAFIFVEMIALMKADALKAILLVIFTTAFLVLLFVRSVTGMLTVLIPPLLGIFITVGIMGVSGLSLSIMNMVILPSLVGISVDNCIHIFHRYKETGNKRDIQNIMNTTGRAAVLTTLTTLIGFGGMVTASMGGLRSMGILAIIGFVSCLLMTWILLPVLLQKLSTRDQY